MKTLFASLLLASATLPSLADSFSRDRTAILAMAGAFEVEFHFEETVILARDYELKKPYFSKAHELVEVAEDNGTDITLQHLLIVDDGTGPSVIKHWAQIWKYEDCQTLDFEGKNTWLPVTHSSEETKGTWTQFVTQIDDSPRYKAQGKWSHAGNSSVWTSRTSTRPLPRRDASKRSDYDLLVVVNHHIITPDGWVHQQDNRKLVSREGRREFLCVENGLNRYRRVADDSDMEGFGIAERHWEKVRGFWEDVRHSWLEVVENASGPIHYVARLEGQRLMSEMNDLAEKASEGQKVERKEVSQLIGKFLH